MARLKSGAPIIVTLCCLLFCFSAGVGRLAVAKETNKQTDPYAREVVRYKNRVTVSKALIDAIKKNNAIILSKVAVRQRVDKEGRVEGYELVQIDAGSSVERMGFRAADRLISVNHIPVSELETKRTELEVSNHWELVVIRNGKPKKIVIDVRE